MSAPDAELRELVRTLVTTALQRLHEPAPSIAPPSPQGAVQRASSPSSRKLLLLFMTNDSVSDELFAQINGLGTQGYSFVAAFSHSFEETHSLDSITSRLPSGTPVLTSSAGESAQFKAVSECVAVVASSISANSAAKVAQGIEDSLPSRALRAALLSGKPVFIARDLPQFERQLAERNAAAPPALIRATIDTIHRFQNVGARFVAAPHLMTEIAAAFHQPVNETPTRLARTKPTPKRVFITAEDVWHAASNGRKELTHPTDAIITDAAREEAATRGMTLVPATS